MGDSMSTIINATTTNGVVIQPDNSGSLVLQTNNGTTALTISTAQDTTLAGKLTSAGALTLASNGTTTAITIDTSQRAAFVAGTAALPAITTTGDTNTGMFFPAADTIAFAEGGTEVMRIDSSGRVTMPSQPAFQAYNANGQYITGITEAAFNSTYFNIGGHYNTSTGRFTAPIAGRYAFHFDGLFDNISSGHHISMRKNGAQLDGSEGYGDGLNICLSKSMVWNLAAGDYISIFLDTASSRLHQRYGSFCGYLLG
jgi:hypothetical protein